MHKLIPKHQIIILNYLIQLIKFIHIILEEKQQNNYFISRVHTSQAEKSLHYTLAQKYGTLNVKFRPWHQLVYI